MIYKFTFILLVHVHHWHIFMKSIVLINYVTDHKINIFNLNVITSSFVEKNFGEMEWILQQMGNSTSKQLTLFLSPLSPHLSISLSIDQSTKWQQHSFLRVVGRINSWPKFTPQSWSLAIYMLPWVPPGVIYRFLGRRSKCWAQSIV